MRVWLVAFVLAACGGSKPPPPAVSNVTPAGPRPAVAATEHFVPASCEDEDQACVLKQTAGFRTEMCSCKDTACADTAMALYENWVITSSATVARKFDNSTMQELGKLKACAGHLWFPDRARPGA